MIGQRIRDERERQNMSLKQLALEVGITSAALSQIEKGKRSLKIDLLLKIADTLHITPNDILGRDVSVMSNNTKYIIHISKKDLTILQTIKKHDKLYKLLSSDRTEEAITFWSKKIN